MPARADARFELRLPAELLERVDQAAGAGKRGEFTRAALEAALAGSGPRARADQATAAQAVAAGPRKGGADEDRTPVPPRTSSAAKAGVRPIPRRS